MKAAFLPIRSNLTRTKPFCSKFWLGKSKIKRNEICSCGKRNKNLPGMFFTKIFYGIRLFNILTEHKAISELKKSIN